MDANHQNAALIAKPGRRGDLLWSMPKGHIEKGETAEQTAIREVNEETGIQARVLHKLGVIDYWFVMDEPRNKPGKPAKPRRRIHKTVHHFLLQAIDGELSDDDVEVTEVAWVALDELDERLAYADERRLVRKARELLSGEIADGDTALVDLDAAADALVVSSGKPPATVPGSDGSSSSSRS